MHMKVPYVETTFTVDKSNYTQRFILENPNIDTNTIRVEVQENPNLENTHYYVQAKNLVDLKDTDRVYWVDEDESRQYELTFGDGFFGRSLPDGAIIHVTYIQTNGSFGNGVQGTNNFTFIGNLFDSDSSVVFSNQQPLWLSIHQMVVQNSKMSLLSSSEPKISWGTEQMCDFKGL